MARKKKFAPNDNNLAIAYYRFSSHSQNDASIDQQRELAHEWADAHGFKIVQEYEDAAISGTTDARPGFQQMLSEVAKIRPHTLIMWKTDRLGRDKYVLAMAKKKIRDAGCEIHLLAEHIPTEGPEGVLIEGLMEAMAEYYSRQLSQNIQRGMDYNAQHALYNGHKLFGYDVDRSTKKYIPDPNTAPFVQWAFKEYASGKPLKAIAEEMNAQGLRTPRNAKFSVNMLNKMLKNRAYVGEYHHGDITVAGGMPVLVDEATFDRAQRRFAEQAQGFPAGARHGRRRGPALLAHGQALLRRVRGAPCRACRVRARPDGRYLLLLLRPAQEGVPPAQGPQAGPEEDMVLFALPQEHRRRRGERDGARPGCGGSTRRATTTPRISKRWRRSAGKWRRASRTS